MLKKIVLSAAAFAFVGWAASASALPVGNHMACYQVKDLKIPAKFDNSGSYAISNQVDTFVATKFTDEARHSRRLGMVSAYETTGDLPALPDSDAR